MTIRGYPIEWAPPGLTGARSKRVVYGPPDFPNPPEWVQPMHRSAVWEPLPPVDTTLAILFVEPINSNTFRVYLSEEPRHVSAMSGDDALARALWTVSLTSGPGTTPILERVENVVPRPGFGGVATAWSLDLRLDRRILAASRYTVVAGAALRSAQGAALAPPPGDRGVAPGATTARPVRPERPSVTALRGDIRYDEQTARWSLDPRADLELHAGREALRKRILRRFMSEPGGFFHLARYGLRLRPKRLINATELTRIAHDAKQQLLAEDEVATGSVAVTRLALGVILVVARVVPVFGPGFELGLEVPIDGPIRVR